MPVFTTLDRFCFVHHRALNSRDTLRLAEEAARAHPQYAHAVEGDLCWYVRRGRAHFYLRHPRRLRDTLRPAEIDRQIANGRLLTLEDVLATPSPSLRYVFELKAGVGDLDVAMRLLTQRLADAVPGRYWIDAFSLEHLQAVKRADPSAPTSLHTGLILAGRVLRTSPEAMPISLHEAGALEGVDAVTLTWRQRNPGRRPERIDRLIEPLVRAGKFVALGGCKTREHLRLASQSAAVAGYAVTSVLTS